MSIKGICQTVLAASFGVFMLTAQAAQEQDQTQDPDKHHRPPHAAVKACDKKAEGDACSFTGRKNREVNGTCKKGPRGEKMACIPQLGEGGGEHKEGGEKQAQ